MSCQMTSHSYKHTFKILVERDDDCRKEYRYKAHCKELFGCSVYASSKTKALDKAKRAIDAWIAFANRQLKDADFPMNRIIAEVIID